MTDGPLLRLLEMVQRELGAVDARVEVGGRDPEDEGTIWVRLSESRRVVALFSAPPPNAAEARNRLLALVEAFAGTAATTQSRSSRPPGALSHALLNEQLGMLAERLDAARILVIDDATPVIWGSSDPFQRPADGVDIALRTARVVDTVHEVGVDFVELLVAGMEEAGRMLSAASVARTVADAALREMSLIYSERVSCDADGWRAIVLAAKAIAHLRHRPVLQAVHPRVRRVSHQEGFGLLAKPFASSYWLVCVFDRAFSELRVEGTVVRVLPRIERLVLALPPFDPPSAAGRVVPLHPTK